MTDTTHIIKANMDFNIQVSMPSFIDMMQGPQIPIKLERITLGSNKVLVGGIEILDFVLFGGRLEFNLRKKRKLPRANEVVGLSIIDPSDTASTRVTAIDFGIVEIEWFDQDYRVERDIFTIDPLVRDESGNQLASVEITVGEKKKITFYDGFKQNDVTWTGGSPLISFNTGTTGKGPVVEIEGLLAGIQGLLVVGINSLQFIILTVSN